MPHLRRISIPGWCPFDPVRETVFPAVDLALPPTATPSEPEEKRLQRDQTDPANAGQQVQGSG